MTKQSKLWNSLTHRKTGKYYFIVGTFLLILLVDLFGNSKVVY
ncbi:Uncharacterised protein [Streptococcus acidominimus]|uniref:Uncharacterized protein n=1 Tax=Streptococcus acidominimus TaxID=1326 RepID=A0A239XCW6_STRAI|nr:Uncharacterised protein [Streptococcus acidominimus]